jgi:hypothetical protein
MLILSADGLTTLTCADPPGWMTVGVTVSSTGSGPGVRLTDEVEMPQPWRLSATCNEGTSARNSLLGVFFIDTAGKLTVQSLPAGAHKAPLGGDEWKSAHDVARCPHGFARSIPLPSGSIVCGMASSEITRRGLSYASPFGSASDPRHFTAGGESLASRHESAARTNPALDRLGR